MLYALNPCFKQVLRIPVNLKLKCFGAPFRKEREADGNCSKTNVVSERICEADQAQCD